jgi:hypothetical protein
MSAKWMPISTAKKENGNKILCFGDGYVFESECEVDDGHHWWCNIGGSEATHWMPLPSPPNDTLKKEPTK